MTSFRSQDDLDYWMKVVSTLDLIIWNRWNKCV